MPYDHAKFAQHASELRGLLGSDADGLSDRAVLERALETDERVITPATKQALRDLYGESGWSSAGKAFVRSTMLDTVGDLAGLHTSQYTETNPIQESHNTWSRMGGGALGMLALQALPGIGQAATGGRIGAVALRAALQAGAGANTNWREQQDQMAGGDRTAYSPLSAAVAATTSGAGQLFGASKLVTGAQDKAWKTGGELAKQAWKGGVPNRIGDAIKATRKLATSPVIEGVVNAGEEGIQAGLESMIDDRNLSYSGLSGKAPAWQRMGMTAGFGAAADLGLNRGAGHLWEGFRPVRKPSKVVLAEEIDPDKPNKAFEDLTEVGATPDPNASELHDRTAVVTPTQQPHPPRATDADIPFSVMNEELDNRYWQEAHNQALQHYGAIRLDQMRKDVEGRIQRGVQPDSHIIERPDPANPQNIRRIGVFRVGDEEIAARPLPDGRFAIFSLTKDPVMGEQLDLRSQDVLQYLPIGKDRQRRAFLHAGEHQAIPGARKEPLIYNHEGKPYKVVTHRKDADSGPAVRFIGGVPLFDDANPSPDLEVPAGFHRIQEFELDTLNPEHQQIQEALKAAFEESRGRRHGTNQQKALFQDDLVPIDENQNELLANQAARELLRWHGESGGKFDLTDKGPVIPPISGLPGDQGGSGGRGSGNGSWTVPPSGAPGSGAVPPGATPSAGRAPTQLDPSQDLPGVSSETKQVLADVRRQDPVRQAAEAAVQQGYPGTVEQAHADLTARARELHDSMHESDPTESTQRLLQAIAKLGGIADADDPDSPGESRWLKEFRDTNAAGNMRGNKVGGVTGVFRRMTRAQAAGKSQRVTGLSLEDMAQALTRGGFRFGSGDELLQAIAQAKRNYDSGASDDSFDPAKYLRALISQPGEQWWGDGREIPLAPPPGKPKRARAPRKPKALAPTEAVPPGPSRREQAEELLSLAGEAMAQYQQQAGKTASSSKADAIYANRLGKRGIELALAENLMDKAEATYFAKLLNKKF